MNQQQYSKNNQVVPSGSNEPACCMECNKANSLQIASLSTLAVGFILSAVASSSCKFAKRDYADEYQDDAVSNVQWGLFSYYNFVEENCDEDYGGYELDGVEKFAKAFGVLAPLFAGVTLIIKAFALFFKFPRGLNITVAVLSSVVVIFQMFVFSIYGGRSCVGNLFDFYDEYYDEEQPWLVDSCEPDVGSYLASVACVLFLSSAIMTCCIPNTTRPPIDCSICCAIGPSQNPAMPQDLKIAPIVSADQSEKVRVTTTETINPDGSKTIEIVREPISTP